MSIFKNYLSVAILSCLLLDPVLAQRREAPSRPSPSQPSRPSPSQPSRPAPSEPRREAPSRPAPSEPRREAPSRPAPSEPRREAPSRPAPSEPRREAPSRPAPTEPRREAPTRPSQPVPTSEPRREAPSRPAPTEPRREAPTRPSQPAPTSEPRREAPSRPAPTEPRRETPSRPAPTEPRREAPSRPAPTTPTSPNRQTPDNGSVRRTAPTRDGAPSPTIRRNVPASTVVRTGIPAERRRVYASPQYHRPYGHSHINVTTVHRHVAYHQIHHHRIVILPYIYYTHLYSNARSCYYYDWLYCYTSRVNGYHIIDDYPFYVYNGYYHRYSDSDSCNYQLVDSYTRRVVKSYWNLSCRRSYDQCAMERDFWNFKEFSNRFSCAETYRAQNYGYFNSFNESDYYVGGYNTNTADDYYENDYRAPDEEYYTPAQQVGSSQSMPRQSEAPVSLPPQTSPDQSDEIMDEEEDTVPEEVAPVLGTIGSLGTPVSGSTRPLNRERDTQDY